MKRRFGIRMAGSVYGMMIAVIIVCLSSCSSRYNRSPETQMIEAAFFDCQRCGSLHGGIFGKGPTKRFSADAAARCVHDWKRISKAEFQRRAAGRFEVNWTKEIPYWDRGRSG